MCSLVALWISIHYCKVSSLYSVWLLSYTIWRRRREDKNCLYIPCTEAQSGSPGAPSDSASDFASLPSLSREKSVACIECEINMHGARVQGFFLAAILLVHHCQLQKLNCKLGAVIIIIA